MRRAYQRTYLHGHTGIHGIPATYRPTAFRFTTRWSITTGPKFATKHNARSEKQSTTRSAFVVRDGPRSCLRVFVHESHGLVLGCSRSEKLRIFTTAVWCLVLATVGVRNSEVHSLVMNIIGVGVAASASSSPSPVAACGRRAIAFAVSRNFPTHSVLFSSRSVYV